MWWMLILSFSVFAQEDLDLKAVKDLENELPVNQSANHSDEYQRNEALKYQRPVKIITLDQVLDSGTEYGHVQKGNYLIRIKDNSPVVLQEAFYGKFFRLQDEQGFKYVQSNDGTCIYKLKSNFFNSIAPELAMHEPPLRYTPAPKNINQAKFDKKFAVSPEVTFLAGMAQGNYIQDLFGDKNAVSGITTQYGAHLFTKWNLPIKTGLVLHYENTFYNLSGGGKVTYSSPSVGPLFKTKDYDIKGYPIRFQTQFRVGPFAQAKAKIDGEDSTYKFSSADFLLSVETPFKNQYGELVLGVFFQNQWLNLKDRPKAVSVKSSDETNRSLGLSLGQVF